MSVRSFAMALLVTLCAFATGVLAQQAHPRPFLCGNPPCYNPPPSVTFSAPTGTDPAPTVHQVITVCPAGAPLQSWSGTFNGAALTFVPKNSCEVSDGTYTYVPGNNNDWAVTACSAFANGNMGQCGNFGSLINHPPAQVTGSGNVTLVSRTSDSVVFSVRSQMNVSETFGISVSCSPSPGGIANCTYPSSVLIGSQGSTNVAVHFAVTDSVGATGSITLTASLSGVGVSSSYTYTIGHTFATSTAYTNEEDQDLSRCAWQCFGATASLSTPGYTTSDGVHNVRLVYNGDRVAQRPIVSADVNLVSRAPTVSKFQLQAKLLGTFATFTNGEQTLNFSGSPINGSSKPFRLAGAINIDASLPTGYTTGAYQMQMIVTAFFADGHTEQQVDTTHAIAVVNTRSSPVGRGWTIAGIPGLFPRWTTSSNNDFYKILVPTGDGSAVMYNTTNGCQPVCVPNLPAGVFITVSEQFTSGGVWQGFTRVGIDSSIEFYLGSSGDHDVTLITGRSLRDTVAYTYSDTTWNPKVLTISDPLRMYNGAHTYTTLHYDANGHLSSIVEPLGNTNAPNAGRTTQVSVDANGYLRTWTDPDNKTTKFGYDASGRLDSLTDRNGNLTTYTYEPIASKLATASSPSVALDFNSTGQLNTIHLVTTYAPWQIVGVPTAPTSSTPWTPVEADTVEGTVTTTAGDTTRFTVDRWGQPLIQTTNMGVQTSMTYDGNGFPSTVTRPIGASDQYQYNGPDLVMSQPAGQDATNYQYGAYNQLTHISGTNRATQTFYLGTRGHVDSMTVGTSTTHYHPDSRLRDTLMIDALNDTTHYQYDAWTGNVAQVMTLPSSRYSARVFDKYGRDSVVTISGPGVTTTVTTTTYDLLNRPDSVFDGVHAAPTVYTRGDGINITQVTDPKGQTYTTTYNALNLPVTQTDPTNRTSTTTWTSHLVPATVTNRRGQMTKYLYDPLVRVTHVHRPPNFTGELDTLEVITTSRLGDTVNAWNPVTREIDYRSRTTGYLDSSFTIFLLQGNRSYKRTYFHDTKGRVDSMTITASSNVTGIDPYTRRFFYNTQTEMLDTATVGASYIRFGRDPLFRTDSVIYPGAGMRLDNYTSIGTLGSTSWTALNLYRGYGYDNTNRVIELDHGVINPDTVEQFTYDGLGELTQRLVGRWNDTVTTCPGNQFYGNGCTVNETRQILNLETDGYFFDQAGSLDSIHIGAADTIGAFNPGNRLKSWGTLTFAGDSDGDRTSMTAGSTTTNYTFSSDGRLVQIVSGGTTRVYDYDNYGQLARRTTNGTVDRYYLWDSNQLIAVLDGSANTRIAEFAYYPGTTDYPLARITGAKGSSSIHYYALDGLGNAIGQFSGSTLEQQLTYDPWGAARVRSTTGDTTQLRWKGLLYEDGVTSLYYMRARWYDPANRRFISPDPLGMTAGINQYAFGRGDPINAADPTGLFWCEEFAWCGGGGGGDPGSGDPGASGGGDPGSAGGPPGNPLPQNGSCNLPGEDCMQPPNQGFCSVNVPCNPGDITGTNPMFPPPPSQYTSVPGYGCSNASYVGPCDANGNILVYTGAPVPGMAMQGSAFNPWGPLPNNPSQGLFGCVGIEHYQPRGGGYYGWQDLWRLGFGPEVVEAYLAKCYKGAKH